MFLPCTEGDDAAHRIVGGNSNRHAITRHHFDPESPHAAAQLGEDFVTLVALHAVQPAAVDRYHGALHVDQIVLTQLFLNPFNQRLCHITPAFRKHNH